MEWSQWFLRVEESIHETSSNMGLSPKGKKGHYHTIQNLLTCLSMIQGFLSHLNVGNQLRRTLTNNKSKYTYELVNKAWRCLVYCIHWWNWRLLLWQWLMIELHSMSKLLASLMTPFALASSFSLFDYWSATPQLHFVWVLSLTSGSISLTSAWTWLIHDLQRFTKPSKSPESFVDFKASCVRSGNSSRGVFANWRWPLLTKFLAAVLRWNRTLVNKIPLRLQIGGIQNPNDKDSLRVGKKRQNQTFVQGSRRLRSNLINSQSTRHFANSLMTNSASKLIPFILTLDCTCKVTLVFE